MEWIENTNFIKLIVSFVVVLAAVLLFRLLVQHGWLSKAREKLLWNLVLLVVFLPSAITGIILVIMPTVPALRDISVNFINLHSVTSFFFMWISGYHILWHTRYYIRAVKNMRVKKKA
jgi:hypothetical protein